MRLRFTIRDLLWLTVAVALAAGWWVDHQALWKQSVEYNFKKAMELVDASPMPPEVTRGFPTESE